jgi:excisionase family DNA binding protein
MTTPAAIESPWLTQKQAAARAQRGVRVINEALRNGELRGYQRGVGGNWRIDRDDLDAWVRGETPPPIAAPAITRPHVVRS